MQTKYDFNIDGNIVKTDCKRLVNQVWKLLPMKENSENWEEQLVGIIQEVSGLNKIFCGELDFLILLSKLEGLTSDVCKDFMIYRKTIFRCIDLLMRMVNSIE